MSERDLDEQLTVYLRDLHAIEQQALAQLRTAPDLVEEPGISAAFAAHLVETEGHELRVRELLAARGSGPALVKDLAGTLTGKGFVAFARSQPDTPGKLVAHAYSYEHMELAAYVLLRLLAERASDSAADELARAICAEEQRMGERLAGLFDVAAEASLRDHDEEHLRQQLDRYLEDAHAIEGQALTLLDNAPRLAGSEQLASAYAEHREQTLEHQRLVGRRLEEREASPSRLKEAAMRLGALNWGAFFAAQPDTPAKLAAFAYAFEHLEIASYELLARVAAAAGDPATQELCARIEAQERDAAGRLQGLLGEALDASLADLGVRA
jgi:ferritin-like metal-binding protein YciE